MIGGQEVASGHTIAHHRYVVDGDGKVWDVIAGIWGTMSDREYLEQVRKE